MAKKAKTIKDLNHEFEILCEKFQKLEENTLEKERKLKELEIVSITFEEKIRSLEKILFERRTQKTKRVENFKCKKCDKCFPSKSDLTMHINEKHPNKYVCKICDYIFSDSWRLELHCKSHEELMPFKCDICEKHFYVKWRLEKHVQGHDKKVNFCHYYNNGKKCPYEELGCKFKHEVSKNCRYDGSCWKRLCQFRHSVDLKENVEKIKDIETGKIDIHKKYNEMSEYDQFDVYQEICLNICWSGFHKCMDHDEDNELLGVNVAQIRDDYENRRKEKFHCEKCQYVSKEMEDVKNHYMEKHTKSYSCWECDLEIGTISVFKEHYGSYHFTKEDEVEIE